MIPVKNAVFFVVILVAIFFAPVQGFSEIPPASSTVSESGSSGKVSESLRDFFRLADFGRLCREYEYLFREYMEIVDGVTQQVAPKGDLEKDLHDKFEAAVKAIAKLKRRATDERVRALKPVKEYEQAFRKFFHGLIAEKKLRLIATDSFEVSVPGEEDGEPRLSLVLRLDGLEITHPGDLVGEFSNLFEKIRGEFGADSLVVIGYDRFNPAGDREMWIGTQEKILGPVFGFLQPKVNAFAEKNNLKGSFDLRRKSDICILFGKDPQGKPAALVTLAFEFAEPFLVPVRVGIDPASGTVIPDAVRSASLEDLNNLTDRARFEVSSGR